MIPKHNTRPDGFSNQRLAMDGAIGSGLSGDRFGSPEREPSAASKVAAGIRSTLDSLSGVKLASPADFYDLHTLASDDLVLSQLAGTVRQLVQQRRFVEPQQLNVTDPSSIHSKIYVNEDYSQKGPVIVHAGNLKQIFCNFVPPSQEEINTRTAIGKENYGTMPGVESAYSGAIVQAMQPRTILVIGEHKGHLTKYLAECAGDDSLIFTVELPQSLAAKHATTPLDNINKSFVNYSEEQIGEAWRGTAVADRIIGLAGDSTSSAAASLYSQLKGLIDLVVVDGDHSYNSVLKDLIAAKDLLSDKGVILVDDFWKPARLFEVTEAALRVRRDTPELSHLYHLSWGVGSDAITSNLAFFIKDI